MESGSLKFFGYKGKPVKIKFGIAFKFICSMACAYGNGKGIYSGAFYKIDSLVRVGIRGISGGNLNLAFNSGNLSKLRRSTNAL